MIHERKPNGHDVPMMSGEPRWHQEMAWYATDDDAVLGVVTRVDHDFGWVVLMQNERGQGYSAIACAPSSLPSQDAAKESLHVAMKSAQARIQSFM